MRYNFICCGFCEFSNCGINYRLPLSDKGLYLFPQKCHLLRNISRQKTGSCSSSDSACAVCRYPGWLCAGGYLLYDRTYVAPDLCMRFGDDWDGKIVKAAVLLLWQELYPSRAAKICTRWERKKYLWSYLSNNKNRNPCQECGRTQPQQEKWVPVSAKHVAFVTPKPCVFMGIASQSKAFSKHQNPY